MTQVFNHPKQKLLRQKLRKMPIGCERKLWQRIRNKQLGYKFFRQYGIGKYVVDFYCSELKLVIEMDGITHTTPEEIENDQIRQKFIESKDIRVKRYSNNDIKENFSEVIYNIQEMCGELEGKKSNSPCPSLCKREGTK
jgi:very-short-patch-repair endonuclease